MSVWAKIGRTLRRRGLRLAACALILIALLAVTYVGVPHLADTVSVTVTRYPAYLAPSSAVIFSKTFRDPELARRALAELDSLQNISPFATVHCEVGSVQPWYAYELHFTWRGIAVEDAKVNSDGCGFWAITVLGIRWPGRRVAAPETWAHLHAITGMPDWHDDPSSYPTARAT